MLFLNFFSKLKTNSPQLQSNKKYRKQFINSVGDSLFVNMQTCAHSFKRIPCWNIRCIVFISSVKSAKHVQIYDLFWTIKTRFLLNFLYLSAVIIVMVINILCNLHIYVRRSVFFSFFVLFLSMQPICVLCMRALAFFYVSVFY